MVWWLPFVTRCVLMDWLFSFRSLDGNLSAHHTVSMGSLNYTQDNTRQYKPINVQYVVHNRRLLRFTCRHLTYTSK